MRAYKSAICAIAYILLAGCTQTVVEHVPCLLPSDLSGHEEVAPLPEQEANLPEALKLWRKEHGDHVKVVGRKNDTVNYVEEHCQ